MPLKKGQPVGNLKIVVDLNGVILTNRQPYEEGRISGEVQPEVWDALQEYLNNNWVVVVATARNDLDQVKLKLLFEARKVNKAHIIHQLEFARKPMAWISIDDRAYKFEGNFPSTAEIDNFRPHKGPPAPKRPIISASEEMASQAHLSIEETLKSMQAENS